MVVELASTVTTTTEGVAVVVALALPLPLLELEVEGVEVVAEGVFSEEYPAGKVDTFGMVVEPVADEAAPGRAANPTAGGLNR